MMRLKSLLFSSLNKRTSLPLPVLAVPGAGLVLLGIIIFLAPTIFAYLIAGSLMLLGSALLFLAYRMRPTAPKARIRVVESDESW